MQAQLGKFLLILSLCMQGSLLIQGLDAKLNFDRNLAAIAKGIPLLACINDYADFNDYFRFALAGLYIISILSLITNCPCMPTLAFIGVTVTTFIQTAPTLITNPSDITTQIVVLKNLAILGGLLYIGSSNCSRKSTKV